MYSAAIYIGAMIRWLVKGCKTNLKDELAGRLDPRWGGSYDLENFIIGVISVGTVIGVIVWLIF